MITHMELTGILVFEIGLAIIFACWVLDRVCWLLARPGRTTVRERVVTIKRGTVKNEVLSIDVAKERAVALLVRDGWKRSAALSALASRDWAGYPDAEAMAQAAWQSMPSYR